MVANERCPAVAINTSSDASGVSARCVRAVCCGLDDEEIEESERWWREHGVHCDEELLLNEDVLQLR